MNLDSLHYLDLVKRCLSRLPGVAEHSSYGTPGFNVRKKFLLRLREDGETLAVRCGDREKWMAKDPHVFFVTEHYLDYPAVLVRLAAVREEDLRQLLEESWKELASKAQLKEFGTQHR